MKNTNMLERISNFNKDDKKHLWRLFKTMVNQFIIGDFHEAREAFYWIKIHLIYDSKKIR